MSNLQAAASTVTGEREDKQVKDIGAAAAADWMNLIPELLQLIASKLPNICDYIRFSSVCTRWRSSASMGGPHKWLPWLILSPPADVDTGLPIFNPADRRFYHFPIPEEVRRNTVYASAHGWLAMCEPEKSASTMEDRRVSLFNLFTRARILLPPLQLNAIVICCNPSTASPRQLLACLLAFDFNGLLIYRQGDDRYTKIQNPPGFMFLDDMIYLQEQDTLYALCVEGTVAVLDLDSLTMRLLIGTPSVEIMSIAPRYMHLVSAGGNLLLGVGDYVSLWDMEYHLFKLDRNKEDGHFEWVKATTIGDSAILFMSRSDAMSVEAVGFPDAEPNQIYHFIDLKTRGFETDSFEELGWYVEVRDFDYDMLRFRFRALGRVSKRKSYRCSLLTWMVPVLS